MAEPTPEDFKRLAEDVTALDKTLGEVKGSIDGLKHSHNILMGTSATMGGLFLAALIYLGSQVGAVDTRMDGVIGALGSVQGELKAINQRLVVLEEIRDQIRDLASVEPTLSPEGTFNPHIASGDSVIFAGEIEPNELASALKVLSEKGGLVRMVGTDAPADQTRIIYSSFDVDSPMGSALGDELMVFYEQYVPTFETFGDLREFTESVERRADEPPARGVLLVGTNDPTLRRIAVEYGVHFER